MAVIYTLGLVLLLAFIPDLQCQNITTSSQEQATETYSYFNVEGGGCLQQSEYPLSVSSACRQCGQDGGTIVDIHTLAMHNLNFNNKNLTIWMIFNCSTANKDGETCHTFFPSQKVKCSGKYNFYCFHNQTNATKCRIPSDETTTPTDLPAVSSSTEVPIQPSTTSTAPVFVSESSEGDSLHIILLAAGVIGFLVIVVVIAGFCFYRRYKRTKTSCEDTVEEIKMQEVKKEEEKNKEKKENK